MARLIDFHTNCGCGADVHAQAEAKQDGAGNPVVRVQLTTTGTQCGQTAPLDLMAFAVDGQIIAVEHIDQLPTDRRNRTDHSLDRAHATIRELAAALDANVVTPAQVIEGLGLPIITVGEVNVVGDVGEAINAEAEQAADDGTPPDDTSQAPPTPPAASQRPKRPTPTRGGGG